jgi:sugar phosphate permease
MNDAKYAVLQTHAIFRNHQTRVYLCTFMAYAILHLSRKCYTNMKIKLERDALFDPTFLSVMDTVFMLSYASGSFFSGMVGNVLPAPIIVSIGLCGSATCVLLLAMFIWANIESPENNDLLRTVAPLVRTIVIILLEASIIDYLYIVNIV